MLRGAGIVTAGACPAGLARAVAAVAPERVMRRVVSVGRADSVPDSCSRPAVALPRPLADPFEVLELVAAFAGIDACSTSRLARELTVERR